MKLSINKTNVFIALLATTLFSTVAVAAVPKAALVKAEPVIQTQLTIAAHNSLQMSLAPVKINYKQQTISSGLANKKHSTNKNKFVSLTKASLIAE
jgi:hypothetical protein